MLVRHYSESPLRQCTPQPSESNRDSSFQVEFQDSRIEYPGLNETATLDDLH